MYLITAKYTDDAERKRIEYALERWKDSMGITKPEGITVITRGGDIEAMLDDLYARVPRDNVRVYSLSETSFEVPESERRMKINLKGETKTIEKLLGFVMAKQKAFFRHEVTSGKLYEVYTKKGRAEIYTNLKEDSGIVTVDIRIKGYGNAADLVYNKIDSEFRYFKEE